MSHRDAQYVLLTKVWDGTSPSRKRRLVDSTPNAEDWNQLVAEMIATQVEVAIINVNFDQAAIATITDTTGGTATDTLVVVRNDNQANASTDANSNLAAIVAKLNTILATLRTCKVILP